MEEENKGFLLDLMEKCGINKGCAFQFQVELDLSFEDFMEFIHLLEFIGGTIFAIGLAAAFLSILFGGGAGVALTTGAALMLMPFVAINAAVVGIAAILLAYGTIRLFFAHFTKIKVAINNSNR